MNKNATIPTDSTLGRCRQTVEPADLFIKSSLTVSVAGFVMMKSSELIAQGGLCLAVGLLMVLASISILSLGLMTLARSASALEALLLRDSPRRGSSELAKKCFTWSFVILTTATLFGLFHSMGFLILP